MSAANSLEDSSPSSFRRKSMTMSGKAPSDLVTVERDGRHRAVVATNPTFAN
jgi:hypothetical protein